MDDAIDGCGVSQLRRADSDAGFAMLLRLARPFWDSYPLSGEHGHTRSNGVLITFKPHRVDTNKFAMQTS